MNLVKCFRTTDILSFFRLVYIIHLDCGWLTVIIWLLCFLLLVRALSTASISPAILQPAVFPRSPDQVIIAATATAAAEVRPPPAHVIAASPPLLPTSPPAGTLLKLIREILLQFPIFISQYRVAILLVRGGLSEKFEKLRHYPRPGLEPTTERKSEILSNKRRRTSGIATV